MFVSASVAAATTPAVDYNCKARNPCDPLLTEKKFHYPHAKDKKYVQCSEYGECFVRKCPPGLVFDDDVSVCVADQCYSCAGYNPCTPLVMPSVYHYPGCSETMFVQCSDFGQCFDMPCPAGTTSASIAAATTPAVDYNCKARNPCDPLLTEGKYHYPHATDTKYVQCSDFGDCFVRKCPSGLVFDDSVSVCVP
eukprot:CAMPEP_0185740996 /NCGR_PEP_ID=MMETSP1171-20130828/38718_1 /TAXON_ID=374046 /ORGANISM="Helicotheca tamensis, Strain CCMP826" /LENGTH=193 /DNA_ID=CAMNT_0028412933 /DNA_START=505 /DNA_END=1086 /DNA_ORIENTATION=-